MVLLPAGVSGLRVWAAPLAVLGAADGEPQWSQIQTRWAEQSRMRFPRWHGLLPELCCSQGCCIAGNAALFPPICLEVQQVAYPHYMLCRAPCLMRAVGCISCGSLPHTVDGVVCTICAHVFAVCCSSAVDQWHAAASLQPKLEAPGTAPACSFQARPVQGRATPQSTTRQQLHVELMACGTYLPVVHTVRACLVGFTKVVFLGVFDVPSD